MVPPTGDVMTWGVVKSVVPSPQDPGGGIGLSETSGAQWGGDTRPSRWKQKEEEGRPAPDVTTNVVGGCVLNETRVRRVPVSHPPGHSGRPVRGNED